MTNKLRRILELIPDLVCLTLTQKDFDILKAEICGPDTSLDCDEIRYKTLRVCRPKSL
jgi:hypothetical protein